MAKFKFLIDKDAKFDTLDIDLFIVNENNELVAQAGLLDYKDASFIRFFKMNEEFRGDDKLAFQIFKKLTKILYKVYKTVTVDLDITSPDGLLTIHMAYKMGYRFDDLDKDILMLRYDEKSLNNSSNMPDSASVKEYINDCDLIELQNAIKDRGLDYEDY